MFAALGERMVSTMTVGAFAAGIVFTVIIVLSISIINGNGSHFWVMPLNQSGKQIDNFQILVERKYFGLKGSAIGTGDSEQVFPEIDNDGYYKVIVTFSDGTKLDSELRKVNPGMGIYEYIYSNRIEHRVRHN